MIWSRMHIELEKFVATHGYNDLLGIKVSTWGGNGELLILLRHEKLSLGRLWI
jgi:hypothetical protein